MNCQNHPDIPATAYCRTCGKAVCGQCRRDAYGTVFCPEHAPAPATPPHPEPETAPPPRGSAPPTAGYAAFARSGPQTSSYSAPHTAAHTAPHADAHPGLALALGFIPGVGAIYNGQYAKGLVHAIIFGIIISILNSNPGDASETIFAFVLTAWIFYMAFEAYHTARKRRAGLPVDEYSGLVNLQGARSGAPVAGVALVLLGILLLLHTLNLFDFAYLARYWPVLLIAAGAYLLYSRVAGDGSGGRLSR
ncbi:MAG TPA: B-box zinc finger protein [Bryobacteraceae bacterium]|nr:B-box zinc finger protein [Bryobacteraceae bacterium]